MKVGNAADWQSRRVLCSGSECPVMSYHGHFAPPPLGSTFPPQRQSHAGRCRQGSVLQKKIRQRGSTNCDREEVWEKGESGGKAANGVALRPQEGSVGEGT